MKIKTKFASFALEENLRCCWDIPLSLQTTQQTWRRKDFLCSFLFTHHMHIDVFNNKPLHGMAPTEFPLSPCLLACLPTS